MQGYEALREGAAWLDLSKRGRIRARGEDRVRLLHAMTTNDIRQLEPGDGCYAFFLNAQGRILADAVILELPDALMIGTEPETRGAVYGHLDKYIIADDVTLEDITEATIEIGIEGPVAAGLLEMLGAPAPAAPYSHAAWGDSTVARISTTGQPGFSVIAPRGARDALIGDLEAAGVAPADVEAARTVRLEQGFPRYGEDITDRHLPHETQLLSAVNFNKGCYIGQEIVERVRSRGGVHRFLVPLEIDADRAPAPETRILAAGKDIGEITSAAYSPALGKTVALAYVRTGEIAPGAELSVEGNRALITAGTPNR
jgi:aminomethyltransferase